MEKRYCKLCGKELSEQQIKRGKQYCGRSCAAKAAYQNPEVRARVSQGTRKALNKPEVKARHIAGIRKAYENPEYRKHVSEGSKAALARPETKAKLCEAQKRTWQNEEYRQKVSEIRKKTWSNEEFKNKMRQKLIDRWKDVEYKKTTSKNISIALNKPEAKAKRSASIKAALAKPEAKMRQKLASKKTSNDPIVRAKTNATLKRNGSFKKSQWEDYSYELLLTKFSKEDIERQYFDKQRYPFKCDFYIKSLDLFIECHYNYRHIPVLGPFDSSNKKHLEHLKWLQEKSDTHKNSDKNNYKNSIYVWTDLDVRKRQYAIDNKLNWKAFYSLEEFNEWFKET